MSPISERSFDSVARRPRSGFRQQAPARFARSRLLDASSSSPTAATKTPSMSPISERSFDSVARRPRSAFRQQAPAPLRSLTPARRLKFESYRRHQDSIHESHLREVLRLGRKATSLSISTAGSLSAAFLATAYSIFREGADRDPSGA